LQTTTFYTEEDLGKTGLEIFGGDIDTEAATPSAWQLNSLHSKDITLNKKKYIAGMGVNAVRPFVPTTDKTSSFEIKNLEEYAICAITWIANKKVNVQHSKGCSKLQVDLPVPDPEEDITDDDDDGSDDLKDDE